MLKIVLRKMLNNRWLVACLLIGIALVVALSSAIPMYTDGILKRMFVSEMSEFQNKNGVYAGSFLVEARIMNQFKAGKYYSAYTEMDDTVRALFAETGVPAVAQTSVITIEQLSGVLEGREVTSDTTRYFRINGVPGYEEHVKLVSGRLPAAEPVNGVYEVVVTDYYFKNHELFLDQVYEVWDDRGRLPEGTDLRFMIVGTIDIADPADMFWYDGFNCIGNSFIMDYDLMMKDFIAIENSLISTAKWHYAFDYTQLDISAIRQFAGALNNAIKWDSTSAPAVIKIPAHEVVESYVVRAAQLQSLLMLLQVPILILLAFYMFMISQLIVDYDRNEIAVFRSRGASRFQIIRTYLVQNLVLTLLALIIGLPAGYVICSLLGASNGFLEFVSRKALEIRVSARALTYTGIAAAFSYVVMMVPVFKATKFSIVEEKAKRGKKKKLPLWQLVGLDIIMIGGSLLGLNAFTTRQELVELISGSGATGAVSASIDPMYFVLSMLFIMGCGLLLLRVYPWVLKLLFKVTKRFLSPDAFASMVQVSRSRGQEQFLILFLVATVSIGLFSANSARTINRNAEDSISYGVGADLVVATEWNYVRSIPEGGTEADAYTAYIEPDYNQYARIDGVEEYTKVLKHDGASVQNPYGMRDFEAMYIGVIPHEFGSIAWFREDLSQGHWYYYLNSLAANDEAILMSEALAQKLDVKVGDVINYRWGSQQQLSGVVTGIISYWPSYNPYVGNGSHAYNGEFTSPRYFLVGNYNYIRDRYMLEPYEVWMKRSDGATSRQIYDSMVENKIPTLKLTDSNQEIIKAKNDPMLQGTNGALTMGFIVTMTACFIGFLIYWVLSIKGRTLQFGVYRAMGMPMSRVIAMLIWEQLLISGVAVACGAVIGTLASKLFVPLLQVVYSSAEQVPPFSVVAEAADYMKVGGLMGALLLTGCIVLIAIISRIRISQAIKLGED